MYYFKKSLDQRGSLLRRDRFEQDGNVFNPQSETGFGKGLEISHEKEHRNEIVFLMETICDHIAMEAIMVKLGFDAKFVVNRDGNCWRLTLKLQARALIFKNLPFAFSEQIFGPNRRVLAGALDVEVMEYHRCYYPYSSLFDAKICKAGSFLWKSLVCGKDLVEKAFRWRVGSSHSIQISKDRWIPRLSTFKIMSPPILGESATFDRLKLPNGSMNEDLVRQVFYVDKAYTILNLPLSSVELDDSLLWHFEKSGKYSVQSRYWIAKNPDENPSVSGLSPYVSW
ncbi:hypothetical protein Ddye_006437 [Dipteronia dyeriana]|uniref:Uncharacterized protein n=1 Tax=Dipteronia dyeriana TaxID=168575 RepID=A0AAE0CQP0_9ROSI|nr:hypothetical protein Ddye_006437 [Dipteronia dyeriana]